LLGRRRKKLPVEYIQFLRERGLSLSEIKNRLYFELDIDVSRATLLRRLKEVRMYENENNNLA